MRPRYLSPAVVLVLVTVVAVMAESWQDYHARTQAAGAARRRAKRALYDGSGMEIHSRQKRTIAFPTGSVLTLSPIFCIPVETQGDISGKLYIELPLRFTLPNSTQIAAIGRDSDRYGVYSAVQRALATFGLDGRACLLRAMCEVAYSPLKHNGLLGEALNILLGSPASSATDEYSEAVYYGRSHGDCPALYSDCPVSVLKLI